MAEMLISRDGIKVALYHHCETFHGTSDELFILDQFALQGGFHQMDVGRLLTVTADVVEYFGDFVCYSSLVLASGQNAR